VEITYVKTSEGYEVDFLAHYPSGAQITQTLSHCSDIQAVHIVSHGTDGELIIGGHAYSAGSLEARSAQIQTWGSHLSPMRIS
jgi:hypothetical protein